MPVEPDTVWQLAGVPPPIPAHDQVQGPVPTPEVSVTRGVLPSPQRLVVGAEAGEVLFADPQAPFTATVWQLAFVPPPDPAHVQVQGPVPRTEEAVPVTQRLVVGIEAGEVLFEVPQEPFTRVPAPTVAVQELGPQFQAY